MTVKRIKDWADKDTDSERPWEESYALLPEVKVEVLNRIQHLRQARQELEKARKAVARLEREMVSMMATWSVWEALRLDERELNRLFEYCMDPRA